jgi:hypothetical protein
MDTQTHSNNTNHIQINKNVPPTLPLRPVDLRKDIRETTNRLTSNVARNLPQINRDSGLHRHKMASLGSPQSQVQILSFRCLLQGRPQILNSRL